MKYKLLRCSILLCFMLLLSALFVGFASAIPYGDGTYGTCTYNTCGISIATNGTVNVNITPSGTSTTCSTQSDSVIVTTYSSTGYTLTLANSSTNTNLVGGTYGGTIPAVSGTLSSPVVLTANTWGYRVDGVGGFGSGPTSAGNNTAPLSLPFAKVQPSSGTPDTIATTSSAAGSGQTTIVWYGVCANASTEADTYTSSVTYTAVVN
jgi:hypothetical protein